MQAPPSLRQQYTQAARVSVGAGSGVAVTTGTSARTERGLERSEMSPVTTCDSSSQSLPAREEEEKVIYSAVVDNAESAKKRKKKSLMRVWV